MLRAVEAVAEGGEVRLVTEAHSNRHVPRFAKYPLNLAIIGDLLVSAPESMHIRHQHYFSCQYF